MSDLLASFGLTTLSFRAILIASICSSSCALLGCYLLLRRLCLIGDAISHAVLPGIVLGYLLSGQLSGWAVILGAMALAFITTYLTEAVQASGRVNEDSGMGIVYTALFALGVLMVTRAGNVDLDVDCVLYGKLIDASLRLTTILGYPVPASLPTMLGVFALTLLFIVLLWKELKIVSFDPALATAMGIPALLMHYLMMSMVGGVTVTAFQAVGAILVIAMLIVPPACAHLLTDRLDRMLILSVLIAILSSVLGYLAADWLDTTPAGMMAVVAGLFLMACLLLGPQHGLLSRFWQRCQLQLRIVEEDLLGQLFRAEETPLSQGTAVSKRGTSRWIRWLALRRLVQRGEVERSDEKRVRLTETGRVRAASIVRAHRLWESYLVEKAALPSDHLHEPAERMEHFLDPQLLAEIASELDQPQLDPHGRPIP